MSMIERVKEKARASLLEEFTDKIYKNNLLKKGKETFELISKYNTIYEKIIDLQDYKLSNKYKIEPFKYHSQKDNVDFRNEAEEIIKTREISNVSNYIKNGEV